MARKEREPATRQVFASLTNEKFRVCMFFNRFSVEPIDRHSLLTVGLVASHDLLAQYATVIEFDTIEQSRASMLQFMDGMGEFLESAGDVWRPPRPIQSVEVCNIVHMSRTGAVGEVRLGVYSSGIAVERSRTSAGRIEIEANPLALLRCELAVQKQLLSRLYLQKTDHA